MDPAAQAWLARQCRQISGVSRALLILGKGGGDARTAVAAWPDGREASPELLAAAEMAASAGNPVMQRGDSEERAGGAGCGVVAVPLRVDELHGAVALEVATHAPEEQRALIQVVQLGTTWLPLLMRPQPLPDVEPIRVVVSLIAACLEHERLRAAATAVATEIAMRMGCERVTLGFRSGSEVRVQALSHSARFDERSRLIRDIEAAMDEAVDQETTLVYPTGPGAPPWILRSHEALAGSHGATGVCTVPLSDAGRIAGALTLEYAGGRSATPEQVTLAEQIATLVGPMLEIKRREERWLGRKAWDSLRAELSRRLGPERPGMRLAACASATLLLLLALLPATYRIAAPATLEGTVQRVVVAAIDGYIGESRARAGDTVRQGEVLGALDDADLKLERRKWLGKHAQLSKEYRAALAAHDRSRVTILRAQLDQAEAEIELLDEHLARARLIAPFDGVVARGDLSQLLGSPVERGEVLFEIAPLDSYRIILEVDEREISEVSVGQRGHLTLSALPRESFPLVVERINPVATSEEARNFFRVEAALEQASELLRPGMEGIGKVEVGRRSLLWIWTHSLVDWLRLWTWAWLP